MKRKTKQSAAGDRPPVVERAVDATIEWVANVGGARSREELVYCSVEEWDTLAATERFASWAAVPLAGGVVAVSPRIWLN